jgi:O-antigen ligase
MKRSAIGGMLGLGGLTALLATVGKVPILARFSSPDLATFNGRTYLWNILLEHFDPTQLLGHGPGAAQTLLGHLPNNSGGPGTSASKVLEAHNLYLQTLYDNGLIGLTLLILTFVALTVGLSVGMRKAAGEHRILFVMAFLTLVSALIQNFNVSDLLAQYVAVYFFMIVALPFARHWSGSGEPTTPMGASPGRAAPPHAAVGSPAREGSAARWRS